MTRTGGSAERRLELEARARSACGARGIDLVNSFAVDDKVRICVLPPTELAPARTSAPAVRPAGLGECLNGHHPVPARLLGPVERLVGPLDEGGGALDAVPAGQTGREGHPELGGGLTAAGP